MSDPKARPNLIRLKFQLLPAHKRELAMLARQSGNSMAGLIRQALEEFLERKRKR